MSYQVEDTRLDHHLDVDQPTTVERWDPTPARRYLAPIQFGCSSGCKTSVRHASAFCPECFLVQIPTKEWYCSPCSAGVHPSTLVSFYR